jgi:hypothetical protein
MKKIIVVLAVLFFASPALAQDYQAYGLLQPYQIYQLDQASQPSALDQSIKFYQPYQFEQQQQQPTSSQPRPAKHSRRQINANLPGMPVDTE